MRKMSTQSQRFDWRNTRPPHTLLSTTHTSTSGATTSLTLNTTPEETLSQPGCRQRRECPVPDPATTCLTSTPTTPCPIPVPKSSQALPVRTRAVWHPLTPTTPPRSHQHSLVSATCRRTIAIAYPRLYHPPRISYTSTPRDQREASGTASAVMKQSSLVGTAACVRACRNRVPKNLPTVAFKVRVHCDPHLCFCRTREEVHRLSSCSCVRTAGKPFRVTLRTTLGLTT